MASAMESEIHAKPKHGGRVNSLVLIGTSHEYQMRSNAAASEFEALIDEVCTRFQVRAIAEEMSLEALAQKNASVTVCKGVADDRDLCHRYCDVNSEQRAALGVRSENDIKAKGWLAGWDAETIEREIRKSHAIREHYWLAQLREMNCWPMLFVCGANHVAPFQALLKVGGISTHIRAHDWAPG
jgi:hypothetical protein